MALRKCLGSGLRFMETPLHASVCNTAIWRNQTSSDFTTKRFSSSDSVRNQSEEKLVLYRAKWMRPLRVMVRLKIFQLGGLAAFALPLAEYANEGQLSTGTVAAVTAVVGGAGAASAALWYYSRRYVGEMALVGPNLNHIQLSVVDFWGSREDNKYDLKAIVPPLKGLSKSELEEAANQVLIPLDVVGERQFFLSLRHGRLLEKEILLALLHGHLDFENVGNLVSSKQAQDPV